MLLLLAVQSCGPERTKTIDYVDPFIDTHYSRWFYFSSASRPFGMVNLSPDTWIEGSWGSGYLYDSLDIRCFSHIHAWQMAGIPVMPTTGEFKGHLGLEETKSGFSHEREEAFPGYHKVFLEDYGITAELTSTQRVGFHRYTFPRTDQAFVSFHTGAFLAHGPVDSSVVRLVSDQRIEGFSVMGATIRRPKPTTVYFAAEFDQPIAAFGTWDHGRLAEGENLTAGKENGAFARFSTGEKPLLLKVAISYTSVDNAWNNMKSELSHWDFSKIVGDSRNEWEENLSRIKVEGGTLTQRKKFYTDLWHALLGRRVVSDVNGAYCDMTGPEPVIRRVELDSNGKPLFPQYNFDALWGSHWTLNVMWSMVYPEIMDGFCNTMVRMYRDGGMIPRGPSGGNYTYVMIGDPAAPFFASAYNKGIRNYDIEQAYEGLIKNANPGGIRDRAGYEHGENPTGGGMNFYVERGYVPEGIESVGFHVDGASMTLEYAYQDWCIAQLAEVLGKEEDQRHYSERAGNYKNLWNPESALIHPKNMDGSWLKDFTPVGSGFQTVGFCESNSAIYTNFVPHDLEGLADLFGGKERYTAFLDSSFQKAKGNRFITPHGEHAESWVDYGNQPSCQMAHLFNFSGAPWLAQKWVREVKEITFGDATPYGGYNGDEDQGQMGALGVLMAIGLFQMDGGVAANSAIEITAPIFDRIQISLDPDYYPGTTFSIEVKNNAPSNCYIRSARLNGEPWQHCFFPFEVFTAGGKLEILLDEVPNTDWGTRY